MKIAMVAQPYDGLLPPNQNSIGLIAYNTVLELAREADVTLFGKRPAGRGRGLDLPLDVSYVASASDDLLQFVSLHYPRWAKWLGVSEKADTYPGYVRAVARELDRKDISVVHVMNYWNWSGRLRGGHRRRRIVLEMHAEWLSQMDAAQVRTQLDQVDVLVAVSHHIANLFRAAHPAYQGKIVTAYNGVDQETFSPGQSRLAVRSDEWSILFVGRVSPEKGIHTLIEAFADIAGADDRARLWIVGSRTTLRPDFLVTISSDPLVRALNRFYGGAEGDDYQTYLDTLIRNLNLGDKVRFVGRVPHENLPDWYRAARVVVNPSVSESFGISVVEGMACARPVVGTRVGGMLETIVDGETGRTVEPERPDLLADAILSLVANPELASAMGVKGRERVAKIFTWRARAHRLLAAYREVA